MNNTGFVVATIFIYFIVITITANAVYIDAEQVNIVTDGGIWSLFGTFWSLLSFRLSGLPSVINLLVIYPPLIVLIVIIINVLKDVIPFT